MFSMALRIKFFSHRRSKAKILQSHMITKIKWSVAHFVWVNFEGNRSTP